MPLAITASQKQAVESILQRVQQYLDMRYLQARRINPKVEMVWGDIAWQQMSNMRRSLEGDKAFGPERVNVAELLLSDNRKRIMDLFLTKSQNCLLGEIVEVRESDGHRTHSSMEIHDMRTLFRALDPAVESIVALIQTFLWWDLEDAADLARFERNAAIAAHIEKNGLNEHMAQYYKEKLHSNRDVSPDDAIECELRQMQTSRDCFRARRITEKAYQIIVCHEHSKKDNPDQVIEALGSQLQIREGLQKGAPMNPQLAEQLSKALHCAPEEVTAEKALGFLENTIATNRKRLQAIMLGGSGGTPFNYKARQLEELEQRFEAALGDRQIGPAGGDPPTGTP